MSTAANENDLLGPVVRDACYGPERVLPQFDNASGRV